jgi:predicted RNase H-like nuclease (RuvC/YqgF family)
MNVFPFRAAGIPAALMLAGALATTPAAASGVHMGYWTGDKNDRDRFQYALMERGGSMTNSMWSDEVSGDFAKLQKEVESTGREVLWFSIGEKAYVVRDAPSIERAHEIVKPMTELGKQQGELGRQQGELGRQQGKLGKFQGRIGAIQGRVAALQATRDPESRREAAALRRELDELSSEMRVLGQRQRELGEKQRVLGERQSQLGERQQAASRVAGDQLRALAESSIRSGKAERL